MREAAGGSSATEFSKLVSQANLGEPFPCQQYAKAWSRPLEMTSVTVQHASVLDAMKCVLKGKPMPAWDLTSIMMIIINNNK